MLTRAFYSQITFLLSELPEELPEIQSSLDMRFLVSSSACLGDQMCSIHCKAGCSGSIIASSLLSSFSSMQVVANPLSAEALLEADIDNCNSVVLGHPSDLSYPHSDAMVSTERLAFITCAFLPTLAWVQKNLLDEPHLEMKDCKAFLSSPRAHSLLSSVPSQILAKVYEIQQLMPNRGLSSYFEALMLGDYRHASRISYDGICFPFHLCSF